MRQRCSLYPTTTIRTSASRSLWRSSGVENATPSNRMWAHAVVLNEIGIRTGQPMHVPSRLSGTDSACGPLCTCLPLLARTQAAPVPSAGGVNVLSTPRRPWRRRRRSSQLVSSSASTSASTDPLPQIRILRSADSASASTDPFSQLERAMRAYSSIATGTPVRRETSSLAKPS